MVQDPAREANVDMDTTHQNAYTQHGEGSQSAVQSGPGNLSSPDADRALQLMGQLFQAHQAGNLADVTSQLQGPQADQLRQLMQLAQAVAQPTEAGQGKSSAPPDTGTDSDPDSTSLSGSDSESVHTDASVHRGRRPARRERLAASWAQQLLENSDKDVIILDEYVETERA